MPLSIIFSHEIIEQLTKGFNAFYYVDNIRYKYIISILENEWLSWASEKIFFACLSVYLSHENPLANQMPTYIMHFDQHLKHVFT